MRSFKMLNVDFKGELDVLSAHIFKFTLLRVYNMIELVRAKLTTVYAAVRRLSGMPRGLCYVDVFSVSDLFELPEEGRGVEFPRKPAILADCTTTKVKSQLYA